MTKSYQIHAVFGASPSDGSEAYAYRAANIDPYVGVCEELELDFTGIRIANSGFVNALIAGLFEQHGPTLLQKLVFRGCLPTVQVLVQSAIDLGLIKHQEQHAKTL